MPFTLSHPAVVIPLNKILGGYVILSALIIGSLSPDFIYFIPLPFLRSDTHSILALFWFCLPAGIVVYYLFHKLLKLPLYALLPKTLQDRISSEILFNSQTKYTVIIFSLLIGSLTHIAWDSFTHADSFVIKQFPIFTSLLFEVSGYKVWFYKLLQHGSTFVGFLLILFFLYRWFHNTSPIYEHNKKPLDKRIKLLITATLILMPIILSVVLNKELLPASISLASMQTLVGSIVKNSLALFAAGVLFYSILYRFRSE